MKIVYCKTKAEFTEAAGRDWHKIIKVYAGYIGFKSQSEFKQWKAQK